MANDAREHVTFGYMFKTGVVVVLAVASWWVVSHRGKMQAIESRVGENTMALASLLEVVKTTANTQVSMQQDLRELLVSVSALDKRVVAIESNRFTATQAQMTYSEIRKDISELARNMDQLRSQMNQVLDNQARAPPPK